MNPTLKEQTYKQMLYFALVSLTMAFAGLTSAYIISKKRDDWVSFDMPLLFYYSTLLIILSSICFYFAKKAIQNENRNKAAFLLTMTLFLGVAFIYFQYQGYLALNKVGLFFTGPESNISSSLFNVVAVAHVTHVIAGLIVILVLLFNNYKKKYNAVNMLGIKLGEIFWHFLGALWVLLFLFFLYII
ncbi:MAG: cytochrome c oxidase subunit 3 [Flavobacteriaceae bacterium]|nr:cytochrome c oxidase subunit 3 [Flavobacteriaceae bacterium]